MMLCVRRGLRASGFGRSLSSVSGGALTQLTLAGNTYINGEWTDGGTGDRFQVHNPATLDVLAAVPDMGVLGTQLAVDAAEVALPDWSATLAKDRAAVLRRWFNLITDNAEELAQLCTAECGKPLAESRGEVAYGAAFIEWFAEEGKRAYGDTIPTNASNRRLMTIRQPVGVCALLTPWNFPVAMMTRKAAPALAAGCTAVMKPAEDTPLSTLMLCALAHEAGVPPGVLNVVTCSRGKVAPVGDLLAQSHVVRKVSFTGSTAVGKTLTAACASTMKRVSMELGGNAPFIVFEDADIAAAVDGLMASKYRNAGQTCVCANRIFVHEAIHDQFVDAFASRVGALRVGDGADERTNIGPLINANAVEKAEHLLTDALGKGATALCGGLFSPPDVGSLPGYFAQPTVLVDVTSTMDIANEEVFGPVAPVQRFGSEAEVVAAANATDVGLAAYVYTRDLGRAFRVSEALQSGMVAVNEGILSTEVAPFGGVKCSGIGREGGRQGLEEYMETKYMCIGGL